MGTISIEEYVLMCDTYGVELTEEHLDEFRAIADTEGEVGSSWAQTWNWSQTIHGQEFSVKKEVYLIWLNVHP